MPKAYREAVMRAVKQLSDRSKTQEDAGKAIGVTQTQFSRYLSGKGHPSLATVLLLADALGISLDELLGRKFTPSDWRPALSDEDVRRIAAAVRGSSQPPDSGKVPSVRAPALLPPKR